MTLTSKVVQWKNITWYMQDHHAVTILLLDLLFKYCMGKTQKGRTDCGRMEGGSKESIKTSQSYYFKELWRGELDIYSWKETTVKLERGGYSCTAVVLPQKNSHSPAYDLLWLNYWKWSFAIIGISVYSEDSKFRSCSRRVMHVGEAKEKIEESPNWVECIKVVTWG